MNNELFFSIIIPNYNNVKYIEKCIDSVLNQTYKNFEIIIVDDGSTDESIKSLKEKYKNIENIKLIFNNHYGVSKARNTGLAAATGEWILFVDADDLISVDYCEAMVQAASNMTVDVLIARPHQAGEPDCVKLNDKTKLIKACLSYDEIEFSYNVDAPWGKLFRLSVVRENGITFPEELTRSEDAYFCMDFYRCAAKIGLLNQFGYVHTEREGSLCKSYTPNAPEMLNKILNANAMWVQKYYPQDADMEQALWYRVLPGVVECEKVFYLHPANTARARENTRLYQRMLNTGTIAKAIYLVKPSNVAQQQYKIRLILYKLHLGWLFLMCKRSNNG